MLADAHVHFFSHNFLKLLSGDPEAAIAKLGWSAPPEDPGELARVWAAELDRHGVARAALIASLPGDAASVDAAASAVPGRFVRLAMTNPLVQTEPPACDAICLFPAMHGYSVAADAAVAMIAKAAERKLAVFVHCGVLSVGIRKRLGLPSPFDMRFSNPLDLHKVALAHPSTAFIVPHFGAGMLREALMLADLCPNVCFDTSSTNSWMRYEGLDLESVFRRSLDVLGPTRLLFGSDSSFFPRGWHAAIHERQSAALQAIGVSAQDQALIFGGNFARLFPA